MRLVLLLVLIITHSLLQPAMSTEQNLPYIIGVEDVSYYPLFDFQNQQTSNLSFSRDLLVAFFESQQLPYQFVALPVKRFDKWFIEENIDFKFPDNERWRGENSKQLNIKFSAPVIALVAGTFVTKENKNISREDVDSLITIYGFSPTLWQTDINQGKVKLYEDTSPLSIVKHLLDGNAIATNIDPNVIRANLQRLGKEGEVVLAENIIHQRYHYQLSTIKHPEIIQLFNQFLLENQELIEQLKNQHQIIE